MSDPQTDISSDPLSRLDARGIARSLSQIADRRGDLADAYFERLEVVELPPESRAPGFRVRREEGLAVRLLRGRASWLAGARPGGQGLVSRRAAAGGARHAAGVVSAAGHLTGRGGRPGGRGRGAGVSVALPRGLRAPRLQTRPGAADGAAPPAQAARSWAARCRRASSRVFYSLETESDEGRRGLWFRALGPTRREESAEQLAAQVARARRARDASPPPERRACSILGARRDRGAAARGGGPRARGGHPRLGGHPEAAIGVQHGSRAARRLRRSGRGARGRAPQADDEGFPVVRRCLLRAGIGGAAAGRLAVGPQVGAVVARRRASRLASRRARVRGRAICS